MTNVKPPLDDVCRARLPLRALPLLAPLRCEPDLEIATIEEHVWLRWEAGNERIVRAVLPLADSVVFTQRDGHWFRVGHALPSFDVADDIAFRPLAHVLFPAPVTPTAAPTAPLAPLPLRWRSDTRVRAATAMLCPLTALLAWADTVPAPTLERLRGAYLGAQALVVGERLPLLEGGERFWGRDVLVPLGLCTEPDLPESALRTAAGVSATELLLLPRSGPAEALDRALLRPLSRAGLRLAGGETPP